MQKQKTISGHYDTAYNLAHNNRQFLPRNVDVERVCWNYYCVAVGQEAGMDWKEPHHISEFWRTYRELNSRYWSERSLARLEVERECREKMERLRRYSCQLYPIPHSFAEALATMLLLPLLIPCGIYLSYEQRKTAEAFEKWKEEQWLKDMSFQAARRSLREALRQADMVNGTRYLNIMDKTVSELGT